MAARLAQVGAMDNQFKEGPRMKSATVSQTSRVIGLSLALFFLVNTYLFLPESGYWKITAIAMIISICWAAGRVIGFRLAGTSAARHPGTILSMSSVVTIVIFAILTQWFPFDQVLIASPFLVSLFTYDVILLVNPLEVGSGSLISRTIGGMNLALCVGEVMGAFWGPSSLRVAALSGAVFCALMGVIFLSWYPKRSIQSPGHNAGGQEIDRG